VQPRRVLVTGVSRFLGARLAAHLAADPEIETVVGVDTTEPRADLGRTQVVRADIRSPNIAKVIASAEVDTVVHLSVVATPLTVGGRTAMKEINVIGTMQLLAACQKSPTVRKLVLKSTTAVYGSSPKDPALFTEDMEPRRLPRTGYAKDSVEVEGYVRGFGRRRPDVALTILRFTNFVGPRIDTPLTRYFALPVVPTVFGFDPRIQFCHEDDAVEVLRQATLDDKPGIFNVGGSGVLLLSQAIRRAGRGSIPVLEPLVTVVGQGFRRAGLLDFSPEQLRFLEHGRVADTTRLRERFGYTPRYTSVEAFDDFVRARGLNRYLNPDVANAVEAAVLERLPGRRAVRA
jgi:UDP-glucose 4-epimerase